MKAKKNWIITTVLLAIFLAVMQVTQVAGKAEQKNTKKFVTEQCKVLAGLQGVYVAVEVFSPGEIKYGFHKEKFKTDAELRLRQYGVKVLSREEYLQVAGLPYLYINLNPAISEKAGIVAVSVRVELREVVLLERNPTIMTGASTWHKEGVLLLSFDSLDRVRECVRDHVDMFINDYLAANPKEQLPQQKTEK